MLIKSVSVKLVPVISSSHDVTTFLGVCNLVLFRSLNIYFSNKRFSQSCAESASVPPERGLASPAGHTLQYTWRTVWRIYAGRWSVSGSKEAMGIPKNVKHLGKLGVRNIAQYSTANGFFSRLQWRVTRPSFWCRACTFCA